jgi:hypothetical protein
MSTLPPMAMPRPSKCTVMSLPKRELLLLRSVAALPNASSSSVDVSRRSLTTPARDSTASALDGAPPAGLPPAALASDAPLTRDRNSSACLHASVLPAPLSPEIVMDDGQR